jgi:hypothetical protein
LPEIFSAARTSFGFYNRRWLQMIQGRASMAKEFQYLRRIFDVPEADCPECGSRATRPRSRSFSDRLRLAFARFIAQQYSPLAGLAMVCTRCGYLFRPPQRLPRTVIGYHACRRDFALDLVRGRQALEDWRWSENDYDWLGAGIFFWEDAPGRAWPWTARFGDQGAVVAVAIRLGRCFDLADPNYAALLRPAYEGIKALYDELGLQLPKNEGRDWKRRRLDCLVLDRLMEAEAGQFQTVRCPFEEGEEAFPGSMLRTQTHIKLAVREVRCFVSDVYLCYP